MTTASSSAPPDPATPALLGVVLPTSLVTGAAGLVAVAAAGTLAGAPATRGAAVGAATLVAAYLFGTATVAAVARAVPALSLLLALLTYALQVALVTAVFAGLARAGALGTSVDELWLAGTVIGGTLVWAVTQIVLSMRARTPVYELPVRRPEASVR